MSKLEIRSAEHMGEIDNLDGGHYVTVRVIWFRLLCSYPASCGVLILDRCQTIPCVGDLKHILC